MEDTAQARTDRWHHLRDTAMKEKQMSEQQIAKRKITHAMPMPWEDAESITVKDMMNSTPSRGGSQRLSGIAKQLSLYFQWIRDNDMWGHGKPVLQYTNQNSSSSTARRIRLLNLRGDRRITKSDVIKGLAINDGEVVYAAHIQDKVTGKWNVYVTLFNSVREAELEGIRMDEITKFAGGGK